MHRLLERLDAAGTTLVPLAYLAGLVGGTMAYFTGIRLGFGLAVGISLAVASELHSFLQQRRTRAAWGALSRTAPGDPRHLALRRQLQAGAAILAALLLFQTFTSMAFVAETWHPAAGYLPGWLQVGIRGAVVPFLLLLAGFLAPLTVDASSVLSRASGDMLHKAVHATVKQWNHRIDHARKRGLDLAPVAISLMLDAGDLEGARRIELIARGLNVAEGIGPADAAASPGGQDAPLPMASHHQLVAAPQAAQALIGDHEQAPSKPPIGGGSPVVQKRPKRGRVQTQRSRKAPAVLRLTPEGEYDAERRIRAVLAETPTASIKSIAERAVVSQATASKWARVVRSEEASQRQVQQLAQ